MSDKKTVAIAGATGFLGRWFIKKYAHTYNFIGLSRKKARNSGEDGVEWRQVDLYSISKTTEALRGADYAIYLVHSMNASTRLNQGDFVDTDLLLADNFARAAEANNIEQIVYMGGILPDFDEEQEISDHLRSRYEVEQTLGERSSALTALRAGIIIGPGGSSFKIIKKLVENLPVMACPKWTDSETQPIALEDALKIMDFVLGNQGLYDRSIEIGGPDVMTYRKMLTETARLMGKKRVIFSIPFFTVQLSKLWVGYFSGSRAELVSPLVESLKHTLTVEPSDALDDLDMQYTSFEEATRYALYPDEDQPDLPAFEPLENVKNTVRSFQRLQNVPGSTARRVADMYKKWLPDFMSVFLYAKEMDDKVSFFAPGFRRPLLELTWQQRSSDDRQLFYITGGLLVKRLDYGWLEFRSVLKNRYIITAVHEFVPRLPWFVYINTQAQIHLWIMKRFKKYLERREKKKK